MPKSIILALIPIKFAKLKPPVKFEASSHRKKLHIFKYFAYFAKRTKLYFAKVYHSRFDSYKVCYIEAPLANMGPVSICNAC